MCPKDEHIKFIANADDNDDDVADEMSMHKLRNLKEPALVRVNQFFLQTMACVGFLKVSAVVIYEMSWHVLT